MTIIENADLLKYNTFRLPAKARRLVIYYNVEELVDYLQGHREKNLLPIGQGSNLLFTGDYSGTVLVSNMKNVWHDEDLWTAESGVVMDELIEQTILAGYGGLENLSHIPGVVAAAAVQNIGAYGVELKDTVEKVDALYVPEMKVVTLTKKDCRYGYRDSFFKHQKTGTFIVLSVSFRLSQHSELRLDYGHLRTEIEGEPTPQKVREVVVRIRRKKLPEVSEIGSAGSFFKNPFVPVEQFEKIRSQYPNVPSFEQSGMIKIPAAWMIEQCGWKGRQIGGAAVYENQPLVLVNRGCARSKDILALSEAIQKSVKEKFGVQIEPEVVFI